MTKNVTSKIYLMLLVNTKDINNCIRQKVIILTGKKPKGNIKKVYEKLTWTATHFQGCRLNVE